MSVFLLLFYKEEGIFKGSYSTILEVLLYLTLALNSAFLVDFQISLFILHSYFHMHLNEWHLPKHMLLWKRHDSLIKVLDLFISVIVPSLWIAIFHLKHISTFLKRLCYVGYIMHIFKLWSIIPNSHPRTKHSTFKKIKVKKKVK